MCIRLTWNLTGSCGQQQRLRGWSRMVWNNSKIADGRHFKNLYSPYLSVKSSDIHEILYTAADFELDERHVIKNEKVALDRLRVRQNVFLVSNDFTFLRNLLVRASFLSYVLAYRCLYGTAPTYLAESLHRTSDVDTRRRLRSADSAMLVVPSTRRSTLGDHAFPVASARAWNSLPSIVCQECTVADDFPSRAEDCTFSVVVRQWLGDRDCTAQYNSNCCLPATTDCRRFCCFVFLFFSFFLFNFIRCPCNVFDVIVSP